MLFECPFKDGVSTGRSATPPDIAQRLGPLRSPPGGALAHSAGQRFEMLASANRRHQQRPGVDMGVELSSAANILSRYKDLAVLCASHSRKQSQPRVASVASR